MIVPREGGDDSDTIEDADLDPATLAYFSDEPLPTPPTEGAVCPVEAFRPICFHCAWRGPIGVRSIAERHLAEHLERHHPTEVVL